MKSTKVVTARGIVPDSNEDDRNSDDESDSVDMVDDGTDKVDEHEDVADDLQYDVYNLACFNYHPVRLLGNDESKEQTLLTAGTSSVQQLIKRCLV